MKIKILVYQIKLYFLTWDKKNFEIIFEISLFTTCITYIKMDCFLIFSYEILKF